MASYWYATRPSHGEAIAFDHGILVMKVYAGEEAHAKHGEWLPDVTLAAFTEFRVSIKGMSA